MRYLCLLTIYLSSILLVGTAYSEESAFKKSTKNNKTSYSAPTVTQSTQQNLPAKKNKIVLYFEGRCADCIKMQNVIFEYDVIFLRKNIAERSKHRKELRKLSGQEKTPALFINGKLLANPSINNIEAALISIGANRKPPIEIAPEEIERPSR